MPAPKRASVRPPHTTSSRTCQSGTHPIGPYAKTQAFPLRYRRDAIPSLRGNAASAPRPRPHSGDSVGAEPEIEVGPTLEAPSHCRETHHATIDATVDAPCDGCGKIVEVELSRYLETSAVACPSCVDALVKGWGRAIDRPTIEWEPSVSLLSASRRVDPK